MTPIQILLIIALSFCILLFFVRMKHTWVLAIIVTSSYIFGITIIIKPSINQAIAGYMGVGRGVDLIFYLRFVFFMILRKPTVNYLFENLRHWSNIACKKRYAQTITDVPHC